MLYLGLNRTCEDMRCAITYRVVSMIAIYKHDPNEYSFLKIILGD